MPKKGKGKKGKEKSEAAGGNVQPRGQDQPGSSASQAGRGRGRGRGEAPQSKGPSAPGERGEAPQRKGPSAPRERVEQPQSSAQQELPKSPSEKSFFESGDKGAVSSRGRGRGRGSPPQSSPPKSPDTPYKKDDPKVAETDYPKISTAATGKAEDSQKTSTKKKTLSQEDQDMILKMSGLSVEQKLPEPKHMPFARRPDALPIIDSRNRITLFVNYFKLTFKDTIIYHYDVDISDATKDGKVGRSVFSAGRTAKEDIKKNVKHVEREKRRNMGKAKCRTLISETFKNTAALRQYCPVYDGQKNLFTSKRLPCNEKPYPVELEVEGKKKKFHITITPVEKKDKTNIISLEPLRELYSGRRQFSEIPYEVLLVYETVMSHREPRQGAFEQVHFRNSFFSVSDRKDPLGCGLEVWFGYHQSVQLTELGPVVVINLAAKAFHKAGSVIAYANDVLQCEDITKFPKLNGYQISSLTDALRGVQIKVTHQPQPRKYKIKAVMNQAARDIMIDYEGRKISVERYIFDKYKVKLKYGHLPCLHMQTSNNTTYIPMETCLITEGQPKVGKLSPDLTSKMIRGTAVPPERRMNSINRIVSQVNNISKGYMNAFGLLMDIRLMKVDGRIMAAPQLAYYGNETDKRRIAKPDKKGVWRVEDGKKFYKFVTISQWVLISFADGNRCGMNVLSNFCEFLVKSARKCGMQIDRPHSIEIYNRNVKTEEALNKAKKMGATFAIVVLNRRDNYHSYDEVKFLADFKYNLVTQCMEDRTLQRINDQITTNVCLKINVKLGGINHILLNKLQIFQVPAIVLGVDAIHWSRGYGYPSILSIVGSLNPTASRYALSCDLQRNEKQERISQEIIRDMEKATTPIFKTFQAANNGRYPHKIIVFRDGVSEGQFQHALDYEVHGIQQACKKLFDKYIPITYIVVQKRHHTRFFPENPSQGVGRNLNVPPGTCVDRQITHPVYFDYFICSHEGIQGTSKPAHYTVLHNDLKLKTDELQELCYFLCHTYVRCTRSVSLPAPVMYADLAAARAKKYADLHIGAENISVSSADEPKDLPRNVEEAIRSMKSFENNMFYV